MEAFFFDTLRLVVWLVILVTVFVPLEKLFAVRPAHVWRAQTGIDLCWYFINSLLPAAVIAFPLAMLTAALHGRDPLGLYGAVSALPAWLKLLLAFVVNDAGAYWMHRWSHHSPLLWRFHAVHHSAEHLDWLVNTRAHPVDMVLIRSGGLVPVYLLGLGVSPSGAPDPMVAAITVLGTLWSFFIHANVRCRLGPLEWLVATPAFHHWHHSDDGLRNRNYAAIFPWIDRLFGTHHLPARLPTAYGIGAAMSPTLLVQFLDPFTVGIAANAVRSSGGAGRPVAAADADALPTPAATVPAPTDTIGE